MAGKEGLEPPTNALEVRGSFHLSYLPMKKVKRHHLFIDALTFFASQLTYYNAFWSVRQPSSTTSVSASSVTSGSGNLTPVASKYSIAP